MSMLRSSIIPTTHAIQKQLRTTVNSQSTRRLVSAHAGVNLKPNSSNTYKPLTAPTISFNSNDSGNSNRYFSRWLLGGIGIVSVLTNRADAQSEDAVTAIPKQKYVIDPREFEKLMDISLEALCKLEGKEPILFIGNTGSGKSSTLNYMYGLKLHLGQRHYDENGIMHILPPSPTNPLNRVLYCDTPVFGIGHGCNAETVLIQAENSLSGLCICDSPGFNDNRGLTYEVATSSTVFLASQKAKRIKGIVITIPYDELRGGRQSGLKDLAKTLSGYLKNPNGSKDSIFFLITKKDILYAPPKEVPSSSQGQGWFPSLWSNDANLQKAKPTTTEEGTYTSGIVDPEDFVQLLRNVWNGEKDPDIKTMIAFMLQSKGNIVHDFDPLDDGASRDALTERLNRCPGISKEEFTPFIGQKDVKLREYLATATGKWSEYFLLCDQIVATESSLTQKRVQLTQVLSERKFELEQIRELERQTQKDMEVKISEKKSVEARIAQDLNVESLAVHWKDAWTPSGSVDADGNAVMDIIFRNGIWGEERSHRFTYSDIPFEGDPLLINRSREGHAGAFLRNTGAVLTDVTAEVGKFAVSTAEIAGRGLGGLFGVDENGQKGMGEGFKNGRDNIDILAEKLKKTMSDTAALSVTFASNPISVPSKGRFDATAYARPGAKADVSVEIFVKKKDRPEIKRQIETLKLEIKIMDDEIARLEKVLKDYEEMKDQDSTAIKLRSQIVGLEKGLALQKENLRQKCDFTYETHQAELATVSRLVNRISELKDAFPTVPIELIDNFNNTKAHYEANRQK